MKELVRLMENPILFFSHTCHEDVAYCEVMKVSQLFLLFLPDSWLGLTDCLEVIAILPVACHASGILLTSRPMSWGMAALPW